MLTGLSILAGCGRSQPLVVSTAKAGTIETPPAAAQVMPEYYETSGPLVVENQVDIAAQREGIVDKILADVGTPIRRGYVLAQLDNRQLQAQRDAAEAKVKSSDFELRHWQAETKVRESDLARDEEMFKNQLITAKQVEHSRYNVLGAKYETDREAQNLLNAKQTLRSLELELEKSRIIAPFDGVVARRYVRAGQHVAVNDRLFWVTALSPVRVKFTVPQELAGKVKRDGELWVSSPASPEQRHVARVTLVSPVVDPSSGTLEVQAELKGISPDLLPGMNVNIRVPRSQ